MLSLRLVVITAAAMFVIACGGGSSSSPAAAPLPTPTAPSVPSPTPAPSAQSATVMIPARAEFLGNRAFVPGELSVAVGTTVTWTNTDSTSHTSTSDAPGWNSGIVGAGRNFSFTFQTPGTFPYHCDVHPSMVGTVVVR
jgi:plastocyanin